MANAKNTAAKPAEEKKASAPVKHIRYGGISASIWANPTKEGRVFHTVTFQRAYKDKDGNWQNTESFRLHDLPKLRLLADKAYEQIPELLKEQDATDDEQ